MSNSKRFGFLLIRKIKKSFSQTKNAQNHICAFLISKNISIQYRLSPLEKGSQKKEYDKSRKRDLKQDASCNEYPFGLIPFFEFAS